MPGLAFRCFQTEHAVCKKNMPIKAQVSGYGASSRCFPHIRCSFVGTLFKIRKFPGSFMIQTLTDRWYSPFFMGWPFKCRHPVGLLCSSVISQNSCFSPYSLNRKNNRIYRISPISSGQGFRLKIVLVFVLSKELWLWKNVQILAFFTDWNTKNDNNFCCLGAQISYDDIKRYGQI